VRNLIFIGLCAAVLTSCSGVNFKQTSLYDVYAEPPIIEEGPAVVYSDAVGTMWNSLEDCGNFEVTNEDAYSGKYSVKLDWNKADCEWIGFGNSFSNWAPTDLSQKRFRKALSFYVRTQEKTAKAIPLVACLEDFSSGGSYYFIDAGMYLDGLEMDTTWKQIIVPLWHFPILEEEVNIQAIKQMQFQLEGAGSFFMDEITLIDYSEEQYAQSREKVELMRPHGEANQLVYTEGQLREDAWGYESNECQVLEELRYSEAQTNRDLEFQVADKSSTPAGKVIHWEYSSEDCTWAKWGLNWNGWYPINVRGIHESSVISFRINPSLKSKFTIHLHDFQGHKAEIFNSEGKKLKIGKWNEISVPMESLNLKEKEFVLDQIRQFQFEGKGTGEILIDDIKISSL
jgi:hypothetical protein